MGDRPTPDRDNWDPRRRALPWRELLLAVGTLVVFFGLLEVILAAAGVQPVVLREDPFVGFVSDLPLFVEATGPNGEAARVTAGNKRGFFNQQQFPEQKAAGTYRIFCLGGSTTYGRPYDDRTSFVGWLRELLPAVDASRRWEVINAGGISYASYRVAHLMEELARYQPDLFIVYTGHNEFLEERSYGALRRLPAPVRATSAVLAKTRTWAAMRSVWRSTRSDSDEETERRFLLPEQVQAKLDSSAGLHLYERDDPLREHILLHYRVSLERMTEIAAAAGAEILFVTPASNLRSFSPFKSQHSEGTSEEIQRRSAELLQSALAAAAEGRWQGSLAYLDEALTLDPRFAELHFRRGQALVALDRIEEARRDFERARDEDVCPLRALTPMANIVAAVASERDAWLLDYVDLVETQAHRTLEHRIPGEESFLDHVHPTIEGHRELAAALLDEMIDRRVVQADRPWRPRAVAEVTARVEAGIDQAMHARALGNLALTLSWAGKTENSRRLAFQAAEMGVEDPTVLLMVARHHAVAGDSEQALAAFHQALGANPSNPVIHSQLGLLLQGRGEAAAAAAHFFMATVLAPGSAQAHRQLAFAMSQLGCNRAALISQLEAQRLDPSSRSAQAVARLRALLGAGAEGLQPPQIALARYPSGRPRILGQAKPGSDGQVRDGIWTEWHENGEPKHLVDYREGVPHGVEALWDEEGRLTSLVDHRQATGAATTR